MQFDGTVDLGVLYSVYQYISMIKYIIKVGKQAEQGANCIEDKRYICHLTLRR